LKFGLIGCGGLTVLGVALFVVLLVGIGIGGSDKQGSGAPGSTSADKKTETKNNPRSENVEATVGETAELRDRTLIVNEVERDYFPDSRSARNPKAGNEFIRVYITLMNTGNVEFPYNLKKFEIQDSNGVQHTGESLSELPYRIETGDLAPGGTLEGNIVFQIPQGDSGIGMVYEPFERNAGTITVGL
jgi:hypothetical protein